MHNVHPSEERVKKWLLQLLSMCGARYKGERACNWNMGCGKTLFLHHVKYRMCAQLLQRKLHATFINHHPKDKHIAQGPGFQKLTARGGMFNQIQWLSLHIRQYFSQELMYPLLANVLGFSSFCSIAQINIQMVLCVCDTTVHHCTDPWVDRDLIHIHTNTQRLIKTVKKLSCLSSNYPFIRQFYFISVQKYSLSYPLSDKSSPDFKALLRCDIFIHNRPKSVVLPLVQILL